ncbi:MAG: lytic murein transglycosylase [Alphaproteobacteria bacterium]
MTVTDHNSTIRRARPCREPICLVTAMTAALVALTLAIPADAAETGAKPENPAAGAPEEISFDGFSDWLDGVRAEARERNLKATTIAALDGIEPLARVIELDRRQPEFTLTFQQYMDRVVPDSRVQKGREKYRENRDLLREVGARYGVQPRFIVALWGIETDFGRVSGGFQVLPAVATLAFDERRAAYFRKELFHALQIIDEGHITADRMTGSWAGAMGQSQFMPSSFVRHAEDYDGDGRRNIWDSKADVFASAANYLAESGWREDQTWGRPVRLPERMDPTLIGLEIRKVMADWQGMGVRRRDGSDLPDRQLRGSVIRAAGDTGPAFLVYDNFRAILAWNRSNFFGLAVGHLADKIGDQ